MKYSNFLRQNIFEPLKFLMKLKSKKKDANLLDIISKQNDQKNKWKHEKGVVIEKPKHSNILK